MLAAADVRELKELRDLLPKSQLAANNALRRCDQLEREKACAEKEGAHLRNEIIVLQKSISVANQTSAEVSRKLQQMKSDCERMVEKATQESQRASMAEARVAELEKERTAMLLAKQRDDEQSRGLRLNAKDLQQQVFVLKARTVDAATLKQDVIGLEAELSQERSKARAYAEEVERPLNVHRWRHLEGSDPAAHEMILQIHSLQRRLIAVTEAGAEKGMQLQELAAELALVREQLASRPGNDILRKLSKAQADVASKSRKIKALEAELRMRDNDTSATYLPDSSTKSQLSHWPPDNPDLTTHIESFSDL